MTYLGKPPIITGWATTRCCTATLGRGKAFNATFTLSFTYEFEEDEDEVWFA
jgi:hypothetical protein